MTPDEVEHLVDAVHEALEGLDYDVQGAAALNGGIAEFRISAADRPATVVTITVKPDE